MVHTYAPPWRADEMKMKVRWQWKWKWTLPNQDAKKGTQKKRDRENTNMTHLARNDKPWKGKEKKSGGRRAPQDPTYLERGERKNTWERGPIAGRFVKWCNHNACKNLDKARRPSVFISKPLDSLWRPQLNLTNDHKKKEFSGKPSFHVEVVEHSAFLSII